MGKVVAGLLASDRVTTGLQTLVGSALQAKETFDRGVGQALHAANLPSRDDVAALKRKLAELESMIDGLTERVEPPPPGRAGGGARAAARTRPRSARDAPDRVHQREGRHLQDHALRERRRAARGARASACWSPTSTRRGTPGSRSAWTCAASRPPSTTGSSTRRSRSTTVVRPTRGREPRPPPREQGPRRRSRWRSRPPPTAPTGSTRGSARIRDGRYDAGAVDAPPSHLARHRERAPRGPRGGGAGRAHLPRARRLRRDHPEPGAAARRARRGAGGARSWCRRSTGGRSSPTRSSRSSASGSRRSSRGRCSAGR